MVRADGVYDTSLGMAAGFFGGPDGGLQVPRVVQGVEDADDGDPVIHGPLDEFCHHVIGHVGVAQKVLSPKEHLDGGMGQIFLQQPEPLPGVFIQVAQAHVKGGAAPGFNGVVAGTVHFLKDRQHVDDAHTGGCDGLVAIAEYGFYNFYRFFAIFFSSFFILPATGFYPVAGGLSVLGTAYNIPFPLELIKFMNLIVK